MTHVRMAKADTSNIELFRVMCKADVVIKDPSLLSFSYLIIPINIKKNSPLFA